MTKSFCSLAQREKKGCFLLLAGGEEAANQGQTIFRYFACTRHQRREFTTSSIIIIISARHITFACQEESAPRRTEIERERERERKGRKT
jgi:hypothetical protein